ncbi:unnamed protein product [Blepharisma stoltei]|uniref:Uncharacterized protein n=1 Tax=Blepharisma stoltei TaxID=1481888 RepID=A0AAU9J969_9CILI|nr:unnamed protein product [Blepharisma stoltei]
MLPKFLWEERWLKGSEYKFILSNFEEYSKQYNFKISQHHPTLIYTYPENGFIYFLKDQEYSLLKFPKVKGLTKRYQWKRISYFPVPLPVQRPLVYYIIANGLLSTFTYRMHAVYFNEKYPVLCHVMRVVKDWKPGTKGVLARRHRRKKAKNVDLKNCSQNPQVKLQFLPKTPRSVHPLEQESILYRLRQFTPAIKEISIDSEPLVNIN